MMIEYDTPNDQPRPPRKQTLGYTQRPMPAGVLAVIRLSWFYCGKPQEIDEFQICERGSNGYDAFVAAVSQAIQQGADVTIMSDVPPDEFGLEP